MDSTNIIATKAQNTQAPELEELELIERLVRCEAVITQRELELKTLQTEKMMLEKKISQCHNRKAPISRLSTDILLLIFERYLNDCGQNHKNKHYPNQSKSRMGIYSIGSLLLVCWNWKEIVCSSPTLWNHIHLHVASYGTSVERQGQYILSAIRYSEPIPLDVYLAFPPSLSVKVLKEMTTSVSNLLSITHREKEDIFRRLKSFTIIYPGSYSVNWIEPPIVQPSCPTPILEELVLVDRSQSYGQWNLVFTCPAPKLSRLACNCNFNTSNLLTHEGQLEKLNFKLTPDSLSNFPRRKFTNRLKSLHLKFPVNDEFGTNLGGLLRSPADKADFLFPVLNELTIEGPWPPTIIKAPQLKTLRLLTPQSRYSFTSLLTTASASTVTFRYSLSKLHTAYEAYEVDEVADHVGSYAEQLPNLIELGLLGMNKKVVKRFITCAKTICDRINMKGYLLSDCYEYFADFDHDYKYEVKLDS